MSYVLTKDFVFSPCVPARSFFFFCLFFTHFMKKENVVCPHQRFCVQSLCSCLLLFFLFSFFSAGVHFYLASCSLLTASISHFKIFSCCFSKKKISLFIPRSNSFSVIHVSVDIKTQWERNIVVVFSLR